DCPNINGVPIGIMMDYAWSNNIIGGTSESNSQTGIGMTIHARFNTLTGLDLENFGAGVFDLSLIGSSGNSFVNVWGHSDTGCILQAEAQSNIFTGGGFAKVILDATTKNNLFIATSADQGFSDAGTNNRKL